VLRVMAQQSEQFLWTNGSAAVDTRAVETRKGERGFGCSRSCIHVCFLKECAEAALYVRAVRCKAAGCKDAGTGGGGAALADRSPRGRCCELRAQRVTTAPSAGCTKTRSGTNARPAKCLMCRSSMANDVGTVLPHPPYSFDLVPSV
jgi:hypothetical protein